MDDQRTWEDSRIAFLRHAAKVLLASGVVVAHTRRVSDAEAFVEGLEQTVILGGYGVVLVWLFRRSMG